MDSKYVVFKGEEFREWQLESGLPEDLPTPLDDAEVIRQKDLFAAAAYQSYADSVAVAVEVLEDLGHPVPAEMIQLRDHFFEAAGSARRSPSQIPTP